MTAIEGMVFDTFSTTVELADDAIEVKLVGNADLRVRQALCDWLELLHQTAAARAATSVTVDVRELEFMNSSCFKGFVGWLTDIMEMPSESQYRVLFRSNPDTFWQRRSLHALRSFALMIVSIES